MAKPQAKPAKIGRNDPCPCGSGKKYKDCHLPIEAAERTTQLRLRQAQDTLLPRIIAAAQASEPELLVAAFGRFWEDRYQFDQLDTLDQHEDRGAERFLTWFAFDVRQPDGQTLVAQLTADPEFVQDEYEQRLLDQWQNVRLRAYIVEAIAKGTGISVRDLLDGATYALADYHAAKRLAVGEVIVGHLVPADTAPGATAPTYYLAGAAAQLTDDTAVSLVAFAELHLADLRRSDPEASWAALLAERSEVLNHYVSALPTEQPDPTIFDRIISEGQMTLKLTAASVASLLGRPAPAETVEAGEDAASSDPSKENA
ncbi:MAG: YecA family protein [Oscillochloridaceae bacterium umkhey_bin13]